MVYERIGVPSVLYGVETWSLKESERKRLNVMEIKCLNCMFAVIRINGFSD